jgi:hypothetical protein
MRVELGRAEVGVAEHLLDAAQVGPAFEEVRRERVAEQVRVDALGLESGAFREASEDQERTRARQSASLGVEEELRTVSSVEVRAAVRQVAAQRVRGVTSDRDDPLLAALAGAGDEAALEVDIRLAEPDGLADAQAGAVQQLDERAIPQRARRRSRRRLDQPLRLGG